MGRPEVNEGYRTNLIAQIGALRFDKLTQKKSNVWKPTTFEIALIINENKQKVDKLLSIKQINKWW